MVLPDPIDVETGCGKCDNEEAAMTPGPDKSACGDIRVTRSKIKLMQDCQKSGCSKMSSDYDMCVTADNLDVSSSVKCITETLGLLPTKRNVDDCDIPRNLKTKKARIALEK